MGVPTTPGNLAWQHTYNPGGPASIAAKSPAGKAIASQNVTKAALAALAARSKGMNSMVLPLGRRGPNVGSRGPGVNWTKLFGGATPPSSTPDTQPYDIGGGLRNPNAGSTDVQAANTTVPSVGGDYQSLFNNVLNQALQLYNSPNPAANSLLNPGAILAGLSGSEINPNQVGKDAGLGYDALLGQLNRNYGTTQNQNAQNLADIQNWFGQAAKTQDQGAAANAKEFATQLAGSQDAASAFINALGGNASPAASGIANASDIANAALRGEALAGSTFDNNMKGLVGLDQAQQLTNEKTAGANRLQDILDKIAQTGGDKAAAVAQARDNAMQTLFGQKSSLANMKANLQGNLFNEKQGLRQQALSELGGLSNIVLGNALAGPQIQGAKLNNALAAGNVRARALSNIGLTKQINSMGAAGQRDISQANPGTRQSMVQAVESRFLGPNGGLKTNPAAIPGLIANMLKGTWGLQDNPQLRAFAQSIYNDLVTPARVKVWHSQHK